jgi:hypothetical protein
VRNKKTVGVLLLENFVCWVINVELGENCIFNI